MSTRVLLLCVIASVAGLSECLSLMRNLSPPRETSSTTLRLTAQRNDTGSWTTKFGDYHMTIEHKHFNTPEVNNHDDGTWTLKVKHTTTIFEEKPDDNDTIQVKQFFSTSENQPKEETERDGLVINDPMTYDEKPEEDGASNVQESGTIYEENQEEEGAHYLKPMALVQEENPDSDDNFVETTPVSDEIPKNGESSVPDTETVLNILEHYRNSHRASSIMSEDLSSSELVPSTTSSTTTTTAEPVSFVESGQPVPERRVSPDFGRMSSEEREQYQMKEERKQIMERYPRSRALDPASLGYSFFPDVGWLKLNTAHWQWDVARKSCQADGGHLAVPDTLYKIRRLTRLLKENTEVIERAVLKNQVFVGVYDPENNRKFTTVKGEPFIPESVSIWFPNEPNDADPGEDCVTLHLEGKLRDVPCFFNLPFICQIDFSDAPVTS